MCLLGERKITTRTGTPRTVINDIAERAGVSIATVSRVLNNRPEVADATREKVMNTLRELGYMSNRYARVLVSGQINYIGFSIPRVEHFVQILQGVTDAVDEQDANLVLCPTDYEHDREVSLLERIQARGVDGALIVLPSESSEELQELSQHGSPFVVIEPRFPLNDHIPYVTATNMSGGRSAAEHLIALGHKRIAVITGPTSWSSSIDRLAGYHSVLFAHGLQNIPDLVRESDLTQEGGYRVACDLLQLSPRPTAIFCFNDLMAIGALRAARELGLRVPEDLSIIGFEDAPFASIVTPALTTIHQPSYEMGRVAVNLLYRLLEGEPLEATRVELSTRLLVRDSTARCHL